MKEININDSIEIGFSKMVEPAGVPSFNSVQTAVNDINSLINEKTEKLDKRINETDAKLYSFKEEYSEEMEMLHKDFQIIITAVKWIAAFGVTSFILSLVNLLILIS